MFRSLVKTKKVEYTSCTTRHGKDLLVRNIIQKVHDNGGRFLKKLANGKHAQGYHYEIADEHTAIEKTRQVFQYFRRERTNSRQVDARVAAATATNGSNSQDPTTDESFYGLITPQSGTIGHQRSSFELSTCRSGTSANEMYKMASPSSMAALQHEAQPLMLNRALFDGILQDLWLTSRSNSASASCDRVRRLLAPSDLGDIFRTPNYWEPSSILQRDSQHSKLWALSSSVPQELLPTSHPYPVSSDFAGGEAASLRILSLAGLSDRFGPIRRGEWLQPQQHVMTSAASPHDGVLGSTRQYMDHHQFRQMLSRLQEQHTF
jgi:hypothetical protein